MSWSHVLRTCKSPLFGLNSLCRSPVTNVLRPIGCRQLFTPSVLGLDGYLSSREKIQIQFSSMTGKFQDRMREVLQSEKNNTIFTEDLKNAAHLAEANTNDIELVLEMAKKFNKQNSGLRFGTFVFGPVVMRMLHHLDCPDVAIQALKSEELDGFFDQLASYQLALDLLYEKERYEDVIDVFRDLQNKRLQGTKFPKNCFMIAIAACYKMNSEESLRTVLEFVKEAEESGISINRRCLIFVAALAQRQNHPHITLEYLAKARNVSHIALRNLRILALVETSRLEEALPILRAVVQIDIPDNSRPGKKSYVLRETVEAVEAAVQKTNDKELIAEFKHLHRSLEENRHITENSLDKYVTEPIDIYKSNENKQDKAMLAASFNRNSKNKRRPQKYAQNRKGLLERE
ncbi:putative pentatricopeptide repeat-containing protein 2, mitochondrial-like [Penaeus vannamei]|uniref:Putative pentatricopeptide repeat-containing protein 2, mitochondrial-like n=1 Tax=Penaeus vannamei TaxID=6689 RepID=A0A3R7MFZ2_PENVA|nr:pentatricopeptide repeat-containing protein 2, mitochondrial-like [Penaeus vannamei]ROT80662.1 putative pentatricopeptide repeat-containing protein 2, mitochondrial-like [Penaeus vannamei]